MIAYSNYQYRHLYLVGNTEEGKRQYKEEKKKEEG